MKRDPQRQPDYVNHILEAIKRIEEFVSELDEMAFLGNKLLKFDTCSIIFHSLFTKKTCGINMLANVDP